MNVLGWLLDMTPWWLWLAAGLIILAATYQVWRPVWALSPGPIKTGLLIIGAAWMTYAAGRNRGAAGAIDREKEKDRAHAEDIRDKGTAARAAADRRSDGGGLRDDDGWRRDG